MTPAENNPPGPSRLPIYLSALLMPGAGQFLQRRWLSAFFFSLTFLVCFVIFAVVLVQYAMGCMKALFGGGDYPLFSLFMTHMLLPLGLSIVIYIAGLCDTYLAYLRECRVWGERKMEQTLKKLVLAAALLLTPMVVMAVGPGELHRAIVAKDVLKLDSLLETCTTGDVNSVIGNGITPLHLAATLDQRASIVMLVAKGAILDSRTTAGFTPLHWAAGNDALGAASLLIRLGADVNARADKEITPLHWAAGKNATNVVKLLITSGAQVDAKTDAGLTPLHWAVMNNADESKVMLAFKIASDQIAREPVTPPEPAPEADSGPTADKPTAAGPRPVFGKSLVVSIGRGEELTLVWFKDLKLWVGKFEVTNGEYRRFKAKHDSLFRDKFSLNGNDQPVVQVSWNDTKAFCSWLNKEFSERLPLGCEFRLPTEAEWIVVAKNGDNRKYPWGNTWPPKYGNFSDLTARESFSDWHGITGYNDGYAVTCPVDKSGTNEAGIFGLAGNVWEWCDDWFDADKKYKVRHGGSWDFDEKPSLAILFRGFDRPELKDDTIGFRLVVSPK